MSSSCEGEPLLLQQNAGRHDESSQSSLRSALQHFIFTLRTEVKSLTPISMVILLLNVVFAVGGVSGQVVTQNLWLAQYPSKVPSPHDHQSSTTGSDTDFTLDFSSSSSSPHHRSGLEGVVMMSSGINAPLTVMIVAFSLSAAFFCVVFALYALYLARVGHLAAVVKKHWKIIFLSNDGVFNGLSLTLNSFLFTTACAGAPEIFQSFLLPTAIFWTPLFSALLLPKSSSRVRSHRSKWFLSALALSLVGVLVGAASQLSDGAKSTQKLNWTNYVKVFMFAVGVLFNALSYVFSTRFMWRFTAAVESELEEEDTLIIHPCRHEEDADHYQKKLLLSRAKLTSKLGILMIGYVWQLIGILILLPLNSFEFLGGSPDHNGNVTYVIESLNAGLACTFTPQKSVDPTGCDGNLEMALAYTTTLIISVIGGTYLSFFSPSLAAIVQQLTAPVTALILLIFPQWNVSGGGGGGGSLALNLILALVAMSFIILGALMYVVWNQQEQEHQKSKSEVAV